jgi:outer membrane protein
MYSKNWDINLSNPTMMTMKKGMLALGALLLGMTLQAQKMGHINFQAVVGLMPETKQAEETLRAYQEQITKDFRELETEFQTKLQAYQSGLNTMTTLTRETKERELQDLQARIQEYQVKAEEDIQKKYNELTEPIIKKVQDAINATAAEGKYAYVFDSTPGKAVLFSDGGEDILPMVKKKMGLQ